MEKPDASDGSEAMTTMAVANVNESKILLDDCPSVLFRINKISLNVSKY